MKYRYTTFPPPHAIQRWLRRPMVEIEVTGPNGMKTFKALIDSGADCSLFSHEVADLLGFDLSKARVQKFTGISGDVAVPVVVDVEIRVNGMGESVKIPVGFIKSPSVGLLLGQEGFFDAYRIKFERDHDAFEIIPVKK